VILAVLRRRDQQRDFGAHRLAAQAQDPGPCRDPGHRTRRPAAPGGPRRRRPAPAPARIDRHQAAHHPRGARAAAARASEWRYRGLRRRRTAPGVSSISICTGSRSAAATRQEPVQRAAETERAGRHPQQLGAAPVQLQLDAVAVRDAREQCGHRGQRLAGITAAPSRAGISPVTRASRSPTNMLISRTHAELLR